MSEQEERLPQIGQRVFIISRPGHRQGVVTGISKRSTGGWAIDVQEADDTRWWLGEELAFEPHEHEWSPRKCSICGESESQP